MFPFSPFCIFLPFLLIPHFPYVHPSIVLCSAGLTGFLLAHLANKPSSNPQIYHLKNIDHSTFHRPPSPSPSLASSSSSSLSSLVSSTSCWYSPSVWPSGEECCQYILWALVAAYLLFFFTSSFLVFVSDHPTTCHSGPHHTPMQGPSPQPGVSFPSQAPTDSQCKSISKCLGTNDHIPLLKAALTVFTPSRGVKNGLSWLFMYVL